ncbi:hypothetical protein RF11_13475 [Thelohanellus kitauei]|uniref:Uncharacterized protein n=1 Tax=Thelohanellus kitauei TaxID=669202 RepID=A0A0C2IIP3_THEKT|nr:hypothetical protein RF11_13475 [Thelohanellus kitauei]
MYYREIAGAETPGLELIERILRHLYPDRNGTTILIVTDLMECFKVIHTLVERKTTKSENKDGKNETGSSNSSVSSDHLNFSEDMNVEKTGDQSNGHGKDKSSDAQTTSTNGKTDLGHADTFESDEIIRQTSITEPLNMYV